MSSKYKNNSNSIRKDKNRAAIGDYLIKATKTSSHGKNKNNMNG